MGFSNNYYNITVVVLHFENSQSCLNSSLNQHQNHFYMVVKIMNNEVFKFFL